MMAYLTPMAQLRLQDKLDISDGAVFCIKQELGQVGGNDKRLGLYKIFVGLLQDVGMLKTCKMLRSTYCSACDYNRHYKVSQNMHRYMGLSDKRDADLDSQFDAWPQGCFAFQFVQKMQIF